MINLCFMLQSKRHITTQIRLPGNNKPLSSLLPPEDSLDCAEVVCEACHVISKPQASDQGDQMSR